MEKTKEQEVVEGNKKIAEFLGWKVHTEDIYWFPNLYPSEVDTGETTFHISEARFHISLDWLMPVIHKVFKLMLPPENVSMDEFLERKSNVVDVWVMVPIKKIWLAVIDFLDWYNQKLSTNDTGKE